MDLPGKLLEQKAYNTRPKIEEHMLNIMDKSTQEEHLLQPVQTNNKQFKIAVTLLSAYNGKFNVTNTNNRFYSKKSLIEEDFIQIRIPEGGYEIESLNDEIRGTFIDGEHYTEAKYPFKTKRKFSTLGSIIEILQPAMIGFVYDNSIGNLLGVNETLFWQEYN